MQNFLSVHILLLRGGEGMWELLFWIAFGAAAIFGVICALWLLADLICGSRQVLAVRVFDEQAREQLDLLLGEAKDAFGGRREIVVLLDRNQPPLTLEEIALLQRYGAQVYEVGQRE